MEIKKCCICGEVINPMAGDMCKKIGENEYMCGQHYTRTNRLKLNYAVVEKILEEKFGGTATIFGNADHIIEYFDEN